MAGLFVGNGQPDRAPRWRTCHQMPGGMRCGLQQDMIYATCDAVPKKYLCGRLHAAVLIHIQSITDDAFCSAIHVCQGTEFSGAL